MFALKNKKCTGFTVIELLVVISLIAVLILLIFQSVRWMSSRSDAVRCLANLRQVSQLIFLYRDENQGFLPWYEYDDTPPEGHTVAFWWHKVALHAQLSPETFERIFCCPSVKDQRSVSVGGKNWTYTYAYNKRFGYSLNGSWVYPRRSLRLIASPNRVPMLVDNLARTSDNSARFESTEVLNRTWKVHGPNAYGNMAFLDGHIEQITKEQAADPDAVRGLYDFSVTP